MLFTSTAFLDFAEQGYYLQDLNELWAIGLLTDKMTFDDYIKVECILRGVWF